MKATIFLLVFTAFYSSGILAKRPRQKKKPFLIELVPHPEKAKVLEPLAKGKFSIFETEFEAALYCNEASISHPEQIEVFLINRRKDRVFVLCPESLDGEKNVATLFYPNREPLRKELSPPKSASRVTDRQLQDAFGKAINSITDAM